MVLTRNIHNNADSLRYESSVFIEHKHRLNWKRDAWSYTNVICPKYVKPVIIHTNSRDIHEQIYGKHNSTKHNFNSLSTARPGFSRRRYFANRTNVLETLSVAFKHYRRIEFSVHVGLKEIIHDNFNPVRCTGLTVFT